MLSVHTNYSSLLAQSSVNKNNSLLTNAMERLSTGLRINGAADDAAGLQIATRLNANVIGMKTANRNVSDASAMLQTADCAMDELTKIANRQKELAIQAANGVNSEKDIKAIDSESRELAKESARIVSNTSYAGDKLFSKLKSGVDFQIGAGDKEILNVKVADALSLGVITDLDMGFGNVSPSIDDKTGKVTAAAKATAIVASGKANASLSKIDEYLAKLGEARSNLGANINRLQHTAANLTNVTQNTEAAAGRIMDADFATESAAMTKNQLLVQAGTRVLSRANQNTSLVMGLLG